MKPIPEGYTGPVAVVVDSGFTESGSKAQLFVLDAIDENRVENSLAASRRASHGQGFFLTTRIVSREIPVRPMRVKIVGTHITAAPIHAILSRAANTFYSVEGIVEFAPEQGESYVVRGELKEKGSAVWIENARSKIKVTEVVVGK